MSKVDKILHWPIPQNTTDVCSFLGLICYISLFLPKLADFTLVLTPLTMKEAKHNFPSWTSAHQTAFEAIKALVISQECLTTIDHANLSENQVFIVCNTSDWRTGTTLSVGPSWGLSCPVAFDSMQLKGPGKNYHLNEKGFVGNHPCTEEMVIRFTRNPNHYLHRSLHIREFQHTVQPLTLPTMLARIHVTI